jgi:phospholipase C
LAVTSWDALKIFLGSGTPIQKLFSEKGVTHLFCNRQAIKILKNDGRIKHSLFFNNHIDNLNRGVIWADKGWKYFAHYLDPKENNGYGPYPNAKLECKYYFDKAMYFWANNKKKKSMFFLGAAAHLVQDLCVPHHSVGVAFCGHKEYEKWVKDNYTSYEALSGGIYNYYENSGEWVEHNANISRVYYPYVSFIRSSRSYDMATKVLLPLAQRTTAGFLAYFLESAKS